MAWVNTLVATCAAMLGWLLVERLRDGHPTSLGAASGVVAGLVAITPAAGSVSPLGAIVVGVIAGVACAYAVGLKYRLGYDDSLDVVGVHLVGGLVGTLAIGLFADPGQPRAAVAGLFYGGGVDQLWRQAVGAFAVLVYPFVVSYLIALLIKKTIGWRVSPADELERHRSGRALRGRLRPQPGLLHEQGPAHPRPEQGRHARDREDGSSQVKLVTAIIQPEVLEQVQKALVRHGVGGMTISEVSGYGRQRGHIEVYRGEEYTIDFITKVRLEVLVEDDEAEALTGVIVQSARTGQVGDGKVWIIPVDTVVRVRTGESGPEAV